MSIIPKILVKGSGKKKVSINYQPDYPLRIDETNGPYASITSLEASLQKNFEYLLMTNPGEWPMRPDIGVGLKTYLFSSYGTPEMSDLQSRISDQLKRFLPSIELLKLETISPSTNQDSNFLGLRIIYSILGKAVVDSTIETDSFGNLKLEVSSFEKEFSSFRDRRTGLRSQITEV